MNNFYKIEKKELIIIGILLFIFTLSVFYTYAVNEDINTFLKNNEGKYREIIKKATEWLDKLEVNPIELRKKDIKGKKNFTQQLDTYIRLYQIAKGEEKERILNRIKEIVKITENPAYHDMNQIDEKQFKQDSTSYLRACYLMSKVGLDTSYYLEEIRKILPRLNEQMKIRGSHQQMAFHMYYKHFGFEEPFPLAEGFKKGIIAQRKDPFLMDDMDTYHLTHEIFVPYDFGDKLENVDYFSSEDKKYLKNALNILMIYYIKVKNIDILAELVACTKYLNFVDLPVYKDALKYLFENQNPNGSFGDYEKKRATYGDLVNQAFYLHTTGVVIDALAAAYWDFKSE